MSYPAWLRPRRDVNDVEAADLSDRSGLRIVVGGTDAVDPCSRRNVGVDLPPRLPERSTGDRDNQSHPSVVLRLFTQREMNRKRSHSWMRRAKID